MTQSQVNGEGFSDSKWKFLVTIADLAPLDRSWQWALMVCRGWVLARRSSCRLHGDVVQAQARMCLMVPHWRIGINYAEPNTHSGNALACVIYDLNVFSAPSVYSLSVSSEEFEKAYIFTSALLVNGNVPLKELSRRKTYLLCHSF